jgi:hypothetical protein
MEGYTREEALASVEPGWAGLINQVWDATLAFEKQHSLTVRVQQVKEKFGGLRIYAHFVEEVSREDQDWLRAEIAMAETASLALCEECGAPGEQDVQDYWALTLCPIHQALRAARHASRAVDLEHLTED